MAPDFEYFFRLKLNSQYSHSLLGVFFFNLPVCVGLYILFHQVVRVPLIHNLPHFLRVRFIPYCSFNWKRYLRKRWGILLYSIIIGVLSHILWDSFTHADGYFAEALELDKRVLFSYPLYTFLQHGSTCIGFLFIGFWIYQMDVHPILPYPDEKTRVYWAGVFFTASLLLLSRIIIDYPTLTPGHLIVAFMTGLFPGLLFSSLLFKNDLLPMGKAQSPK